MAATNFKTFVPPADLLTPTNYKTWKEYMKVNLKRKDLWEPTISEPYHKNTELHSSTTVPLKSFSSELNRDRMALEAIKKSCGLEMLPLIRYAEFASEAWTWLKEAADATDKNKDKYSEMVRQAAVARANLKEVPLVDKVLMCSNYGKWKTYMKNLLVSEYLWGVVSGGENSESPGYKMKNHTASVTLRMSCGKKMFNLILEQNNAHDAWLMLGAAFNVAPDEIKDSVAITIGSTLPPSPQVFSDYESWKIFMETYLNSKNLWGFLEVPSRLDPEQDEKALDAIKLYCGPHMRNIIPYVDCAKSAWVELEAERKEFQEAYETRDDEGSMRPGGMSTGPPEALTHTNYDEWSSHMTRYLKSLQLWEIVSTGDDNSSTTTASKSICKIKNACALKIIKDACEPQMLCCIFYKTKANKAWNWLKIKADTEKKEKYLKYSQLLHAVQKDKFVENIKKQDSKIIYYNWRGADKFFRDFPEALTAEITEDGSTALHIAVRLGRVDFVKELLKLMTPAQLETKTHKHGDTVLSVAAKGNYIEIVQMLADKNPYLLQIENKAGHSPLAMAAIDGNEAVFRYLYDKTPQTMLWKTGVTENRIGTLLTSAARHEAFEVVLDQLKKLEEKKSAKLVFSQDDDKMNLLSVLARKPCAFPSGNKLGKCRRFIHWVGKRWRAFKGGKQPLDCKVKYAHTDDILKRICSGLPNLGPNKLKEALVNDAIHQSAIHGISEIFESLIDTNPYLEHYLEEEFGRGLFQIAIMSRQESIYLYICQMGQRNQNIAIVDKLRNNTLHCAGFWIPSPQLDKAHGPALQMQREIQWFQEVEKVVPPRFKDMKNDAGMTPKAFFTDQHKELAQQGEKWMKDTAQACMLVTTLIATVMFAAAFTLPGGNDQNTGRPLFLKSAALKVFIVADAVSLFSSCTSVLMFFSILTARFVERDFLISLPRKLILGLFTLFISIATMMITFGTTLVIVFRGEISWVYIPVSILAAIPVLLFGLLQLPLFCHIVKSTYGRGLFHGKRPVLIPLTSISYGQ